MGQDKIALFLHNIGGGGAERVTLTLAGCLVERGLQVDLVLGQLKGELVSAVPDGVRVVELNAGRALACISLHRIQAEMPTRGGTCEACSNVASALFDSSG